MCSVEVGVYYDTPSLLAVATVFIGVWALFTVKERGLIIKPKRPMQKKMQGGDLCVRGGVITGFYGIMHQVGTILFTPLHMHTG